MKKHAFIYNFLVYLIKIWLKIKKFQQITYGWKIWEIYLLELSIRNDFVSEIGCSQRNNWSSLSEAWNGPAFNFVLKLLLNDEMCTENT